MLLEAVTEHRMEGCDAATPQESRAEQDAKCIHIHNQADWRGDVEAEEPPGSPVGYKDRANPCGSSVQTHLEPGWKRMGAR